MIPSAIQITVPVSQHPPIFDNTQTCLARGRALEKRSPDNSSMMASLAKADRLLIREPHAPPVKAGSRCEIVKLDP
jgi:molybdopterin biosynthesis enzyme